MDTSNPIITDKNESEYNDPEGIWMKASLLRSSPNLPDKHHT